MRCSSYCSVTEYDIQGLVQNLINSGLEPKYFDEVIHIQRDFHKNDRSVDVFVFSFGSVVIWGATESEEKMLLDDFNKYGVQISEDTAVDLIHYHYDQKGSKTYINEENNEIILHDKSVFLKLSISHALAQSVKLSILELSVKKLFAKTSPLQKELARRGRVSLSKTDLSKEIGTLFNERYSINLHSDILDTPEFFWRRPRYEPLYTMTAEFQDIQLRQNIMNHRLGMIQELYSLLSNELNYIHSTRLEMVIVILIAIEVILALSHHELVAKLFCMVF